MRIDFPDPGEPPQLKALFQQAFGDDEALVDSFFRTGFCREKSRRISENGEVTAALYWFDAEMGPQRYAYLYAVATRQDCRGRGLCRRLMEDTLQHLAGQGYAGALLVPGSEALAEMYRKMGFRFCTSIAEFSCEAGTPAALTEISPARYAALRRRALPEGGALQEGAQLDYLNTFVRFYEGEGFLAAGSREDNAFLCTELLGSPHCAPGITGALACKTGTFRTPGTGRDFAMFYSLKPDAVPPAYFGLAMD